MEEWCPKAAKEKLRSFLHGAPCWSCHHFYMYNCVVTNDVLLCPEQWKKIVKNLIYSKPLVIFHCTGSCRKDSHNPFLLLEFTTKDHPRNRFFFCSASGSQKNKWNMKDSTKNTKIATVYIETPMKGRVCIQSMIVPQQPPYWSCCSDVWVAICIPEKQTWTPVCIYIYR